MASYLLLRDRSSFGSLSVSFTYLSLTWNGPLDVWASSTGAMLRTLNIQRNEMFRKSLEALIFPDRRTEDSDNIHLPIQSLDLY